MDEPPGYTLLTIASDGSTLKLILSLSAVIILLGVEAFIAASEVAFFTLRNSDLERLRKSSQSREQLIPELMQRPRQLLATIRIAGSFVVIAIILAAIAFVISLQDSMIGLEVILFAIAITFLLTSFGEIIPKSYAASNGIRTARYVAGFWKVLIPVFKPILGCLAKGQ